MKKIILLFIISLFSYQFIYSQCLPASTQILHFTKTNGFDHNTRSESAQMFTEIGSQENFTITNTDDASIFDNLSQLNAFSIIIFSNTSGNNLLTSDQQDNMETFINAGGHFLGIHAATDTYRNGSWPFYTNLIGGIVQTNPNHTSSNHVNDMDHMESGHPILSGIPDPWNKEEEYYYWELNGGFLSPDITELLRVRSTGPNSYDAARPTAWFQQFSTGARSFYTSLGHKRNNFTDPDNEFRLLLKNAICWLMADPVLSVSGVNVYGDKDDRGNNLYWSNSQNIQKIKIYRGETASSLDVLIQTENQQEIQLGVYLDKDIQSNTGYYYQLEITLNDGSSEKLDMIYLGQRLPKRLSMFPNPAKDYFMLDANIAQATRLEIYNMAGQLIYEKNRDFDNSMNCSDWKTGMYLVKLTFKNGRHAMEKLILEH